MIDLIWRHLTYFAATAIGVILLRAGGRLVQRASLRWTCLRSERLVPPPRHAMLRISPSFPGRRQPVDHFHRWEGPARLVGLLASLVGATTASAGDSWPSFQNGGWLSLEPVEDESRIWRLDGPVWSVEIPGSGQSSPVVWRKTVYVTSASGARKETGHVVAYRLADGARLWQQDVPNPSPVEDSGYVSRAAPTAAADERGVIALFEGGFVIALAPDGRIRWQRNLVEEFGPVESRHGLAASVEQSADAAFLWIERQEDPYVLAIHKDSGETLWKQPGVGATSWASPRLVPVSGGTHLVLSAIGSLTGLDPATGERLWTLGDLSGNSTPTPIPLGEGRMFVGATDGRGEAAAAKNAESNGVVRIVRDEALGWRAEYEWRAAKATCSFGSPLVHRGQAYIVNRAGVVHCFDVSTGKLRYAERIPGSIWATPVGIGGSVLMCCKDGPLAVLAAGPQFQLLSETAPTAEPGDADQGRTVYGVAVAGESVLVREGNRLRCWRLVAAAFGGRTDRLP